MKLVDTSVLSAPNHRATRAWHRAKVWGAWIGRGAAAIARRITGVGHGAAGEEGPPAPVQVMFERASVGIALVRQDRRILHANPAFVRFLGRPLPELRGCSLSDFAHVEDAEATRELFERMRIPGSAPTSLEARFVRADGSLRWGSLGLTREDDSASSHIVAVLQDTSERKRLESQLLHQAFHDALTRLPNRALLRDRIERAIERASRTPHGLTLLLLDLDNFKDVNDTQGHAAGDLLLKSVADRLLSATRGSDTVARLGGDEFAVLLENVDDHGGIEALLDRIIGSLRRPLSLPGAHSVTPSASIGVAVYSGSEGTEELLRNADLAMYDAKLVSRGRWAVFDPAMHDAALDRVTMETDLKQALARCQLVDRPRLHNTARFPAFGARTPAPAEFHLAYQPIVHLASGRVTALEALARWQHPKRGAVPPDWFIPVAEQNGSIIALGRWVLREACRQAVRWNEESAAQPVAITVNLSGRQLAREGIVSDVDAILRETRLAPELLVLEITETAVMQDAACTLDRLVALKALGVRLAIDDFGTGYSSLAYLQRFPVDLLKIDRVFADGLRDGAPESMALIRTILALARTLSLTTVFEGIEDAAQCARLRELGCESGQGYHFGRPITADEVLTLMARRTDADASVG